MEEPFEVFELVIGPESGRGKVHIHHYRYTDDNCEMGKEEDAVGPATHGGDGGSVEKME